MDRVEAVVVGAGVIGLAVGRALALAGREVIVLEAADAFGTGISSRNSEVIHAGIYYPAGSLKARLCVAGRHMLYAYCAERGVAHARLGKLIVAADEAEAAQLRAILAAGHANGVTDLVSLTRDQARALEPEISCAAALHSPSTGIVDSHGLMLALLGEIEDAGGALALWSPLGGAECTDDGFVLEVDGRDGVTALGCRVLVNAAGLAATEVAGRIAGLDARHVPRMHLSRGCYFALQGRAPFRRLVYPVPKSASLGTHLTLDLGGQAKFGPDQEWIDRIDYTVDPARAEGFYAEIRRYWPGLPDGSLAPAYAGIRPKLQAPGEPPADFRVDGPSVHGVPGLVNLFGIESPGLTSALALADHAVEALSA
jgi:L-2-hydroxyglutarate oxidase LhgO